MTRRDDDLAPWQRLGAKFRLGLRARPESEWLPFDDAFGNTQRRSEQIKMANALLDQQHAAVFAVSDPDHTAANEVLAMVVDNLARFHPDGPPAPRRDLHPLEAAARLIPEDLLLLDPRPRHTADAQFPDWVLVAAALRFPAHWRLADKMDKPLAAIHEPVPHYGAVLETPMDRFFTNMKIGPISHRWNWTVVTSPELFTPDRAHNPPVRIAEGIDRLRVRMESQTLRKLPESGQILFTIRTYSEPVLNWVDCPDAIEELAEMTAAMSPPVRDYKGVDRYEAALQHYVATRQA